MKKAIYIIFSIIIYSLLSKNIFAVETGQIPLEVDILNGSNQNTQPFTFVIEADDKDYPMPEGSIDGKYTLTVNSSGEYTLGSIKYDKVGDYTYKIYQVKKDNNDYTYDDRVYTLYASVTNNEDYTDLNVQLLIILPDSEEKYSKPSFKNEYFPPKSEPSINTSDINFNIIVSIFALSFSGILLKNKLFE